MATETVQELKSGREKTTTTDDGRFHGRGGIGRVREREDEDKRRVRRVREGRRGDGRVPADRRRRRGRGGGRRNRAADGVRYRRGGGEDEARRRKEARVFESLGEKYTRLRQTSH